MISLGMDDLRGTAELAPQQRGGGELQRAGHKAVDVVERGDGRCRAGLVAEPGEQRQREAGGERKVELGREVPQPEVGPRITSYNVCYTKLLREPDEPPSRDLGLG